MKKVMFALAVAGMFCFAACGSNAEENANDSMANDTVAAIENEANEAENTDTTMVEAQAEETETVADAQ